MREWGELVGVYNILVERGGGENGELAPNIFEDGELFAWFVVLFRFLCVFPAGREGKMRIYPRLIMTRRTTPLQGPIIGGGEKTIEYNTKKFILLFTSLFFYSSLISLH